MKNIFLALIIVTIILSLGTIAVHADEVTTEEVVAEEIVTEVVTEPTEESVEEIETPTETETPTENPTEAHTTGELGEVATFIDRIEEAWENGDINLVISIAIEAAMFVFMVILKKSGNKNADLIADKSREITKGFNTVVDAANEITDAINGDDGLKNILKGETKELTEAVQEGLKALQELDKEKLIEYGNQLTACVASVKCLAEMLQHVYANSTTIPMSVKGVINEKYVEICRNLDNGGDTNA